MSYEKDLAVKKHAYLLEHYILPSLPTAAQSAAVVQFIATSAAVREPVLYAIAEHDMIYPDLAAVSVDHNAEGAGFRVDLPLLTHDIETLFAPGLRALSTLNAPQGMDLHDALYQYIIAPGSPSADMFVQALSHKLGWSLNAADTAQLEEDVRMFRATILGADSLDTGAIARFLADKVLYQVAKRVPVAAPERNIEDLAQQQALLNGNVGLVRFAQQALQQAKVNTDNLLALPVMSTRPEIVTLHDALFERVDFPQLNVLPAVISDIDTVDKLLVKALHARQSHAGVLEVDRFVADTIEPTIANLALLRQFSNVLTRAVELTAREGHPIEAGSRAEFKAHLDLINDGVDTARSLLSMRSKVVERHLPTVTRDDTPPQLTDETHHVMLQRKR